jgi:pimeloyl-ACP methyl ester carboxylesterase
MTPDAVSDSKIVDAFVEAAMQSGAKVPTGPQLDMINKMPMLNPSRITVPVMLIHGEHDDVADMDGLLPFFKALPNPEKRYVVIPDAGHMIMFQKGRHRFHRAVIDFIKAS